VKMKKVLIPSKIPTGQFQLMASMTRLLGAKDAFEATGRRQFLDTRIVASIPSLPDVLPPAVTLFKHHKDLHDGSLIRTFHDLRLRPAHPLLLLAVNEWDPTLLGDHCPNATIWDNLSFVTFNCANGERAVSVGRYKHGWRKDEGWWFAGVPLTT